MNCSEELFHAHWCNHRKTHRASYQTGGGEKEFTKDFVDHLIQPLFFEKDTESDICASQIVCQWLGGGYNPISWF